MHATFLSQILLEVFSKTLLPAQRVCENQLNARLGRCMNILCKQINLKLKCVISGLLVAPVGIADCLFEQPDMTGQNSTGSTNKVSWGRD